MQMDHRVASASSLLGDGSASEVAESDLIDG